MNKAAVKKFAVWAREKMLKDVATKARYFGIGEDGYMPVSKVGDAIIIEGIKTPYGLNSKEMVARNALIARIDNIAKESDYKTAYQTLIEEIAYTWFNRIFAIRFMEVNGYLPSNIRVLSSLTPGKTEPDIVTHPFEAELNLTEKEKDLVFDMKMDAAKQDELFKFLFIKQCNVLNQYLPELFENMNDYTEMLIDLKYTDSDSVVRRIVSDIDENDWKETVEIVGWIYQFYNSERKAIVDAYVKNGKKVIKEDVPAKTQLFTPDWIVRYLVDNSLGRLWLEHNPNSNLRKHLDYYIEEAEQSQEIAISIQKNKSNSLSPQDIKFMDPSMGSGHILIYAFDVLVNIYKECGYSERDIPEMILKHNLYGLELDKRAYQLAYFSLMMKARQYDKNYIKDKNKAKPILYFFIDSKDISKSIIDNFGFYYDNKENISKCKEDLATIIDAFKDARELGSILKIDSNIDYDELLRYLGSFQSVEIVRPDFEIYNMEKQGDALTKIVKIARRLNDFYHIVCTNPPYFSSGDMSSYLSDYCKKNYPNSKSDLFAVFMEIPIANKCQYLSMINMHSWLFLSSYEKMRKKIIENKAIISMAHLGARAFNEISGEVVQTVAFILSGQKHKSYKGSFIRLVDYKSQDEKEKAFLEAIKDNNCKYRYTCSTENFAKIPGSPVAYWIAPHVYMSFNNKSVENCGTFSYGVFTCNNARFLRLWYEVNTCKVNFMGEGSQAEPWCLLNKGGTGRKWYGNLEYIINYGLNGYTIRSYRQESGQSESLPGEAQYFKSHISWSLVTSGNLTFRYYPSGMIFDISAPSMFCDNEQQLLSTLALLNSKVGGFYLPLFNPTMNNTNSDIKRIPYLLKQVNVVSVSDIAKQSISLSRADWDSFETSWDFKKHPLLSNKPTIEEAYNNMKDEFNERFFTLKKNEEELNRIFIEIYGLQDELTPDVSLKDVTVSSIFDSKEDIPAEQKGNAYNLTKTDVIKSFISYAVGCMFGRYSLDTEGLAYAGGDWDSSKYKRFLPDSNNVIPITDEHYFEDDIVGYFINFVEVVFGKQTLEQNLEFIADALNRNGDTSRQAIRKYFVNDFYKDHVKTYKKRPIYWQFDSGKQGGFKALIYLHRYDEDTVGIVRTEYLHKVQRAYQNTLDNVQYIIDNSKDKREISFAKQKKEKLLKQLQETKDYDAVLSHIALKRIALDLDDGVKVNYEKFQNIEYIKKDSRPVKINLLTKI